MNIIIVFSVDLQRKDRSRKIVSSTLSLALIQYTCYNAPSAVSTREKETHEKPKISIFHMEQTHEDIIKTNNNMSIYIYSCYTLQTTYYGKVVDDSV